MRYPKGVQEKINVLKIYDLNIELTEYNIFHLYPKGLAYPNGYYDSRFFNLVGYNSETNSLCQYILEAQSIIVNTPKKAAPVSKFQTEFLQSGATFSVLEIGVWPINISE